MTARERKFKQEKKAVAYDYLKKASDNFDQMQIAFKSQNWNAAATLALQCAISSADAICVYEKGMRSISQNHMDVCDILAQLPIRGSKEKTGQLRKIITRKNVVQYESRNVRKSEVDEMVKITTRLHEWVKVEMGE